MLPTTAKGSANSPASAASITFSGNMNTSMGSAGPLAADSVWFEPSGCYKQVAVKAMYVMSESMSRNTEQYAAI